jgi:hypothetical protein
MSLIGATVVQTGLVIRAVADFLFKDGNKKDSG